ncbi:MAG: TetR family transcriptional regulator [Propionibacteriales bacterium]|nr:TetR family transcriptional regulator [Propionibacteriales bacterium]
MKEQRNFRGQTPEERKQRRRLKLIDSTLTVIHDGGLTALGVRSVLAEANLSSRYFYENFTSIDNLLIEATRSVAQELLAAGVQALVSDDVPPAGTADDELLARFRGGLAAALEVLLADPRKVALMVAARAGGPLVRQEIHQNLTFLVAAAILDQAGAPELGFDESSTLYAAGGLVNLTMAFVSGQHDITPEHLVDRLARFTLGVLRASLSSPGS